MIKSSDALLYAGAAVVGAGVLYAVVRKGPSTVVHGVTDAVTEVGRSTGVIAAPGSVYEGRGVIGSAGNIANELSGGVLERIGGWIGRRIADLRGI